MSCGQARVEVVEACRQVGGGGWGGGGVVAWQTPRMRATAPSCLYSIEYTEGVKITQSALLGEVAEAPAPGGQGRQHADV